MLLGIPPTPSCLSISCPLPFIRGRVSYWPILPVTNNIQLKNLRLHLLHTQAVSRKGFSQDNVEDASDEDTVKGALKNQRAPRRRRKKNAEIPEENATVSSLKAEAESTAESPSEDSKKVARRGRKKASTVSSSKEEIIKKKAPKRRTKKNIEPQRDEDNDIDLSDIGQSISSSALVDEVEELQVIEDEEDISFTYSWPPLVCCFGAAQHDFIPSGRPANRLIDHEIHDAKKDMFWSPTKFVRAPGSSSSSVAIALASIGGRVAFMGKVGDDEYGHSLLYHLNINNVQTRSVTIDASRPTAISQMKISRRGGLRMNCVKPCAEYSFQSSEIDIDTLKEAKMFYFNSSSLLDQNMRRATMQAIQISKKLGGVVFFDLNLPLPMWASSEETKTEIQQAWEIADIIEVTKQELEFLCGIEPNERFDTKDNEKSKFVHYEPEVVKTLWHENLKVLFVTNGTSKIHYYTEKDNGWVRGMEDAPITPFTGDMSKSGDAIVAALMRMLSVQPHLVTDKGYLVHMIKYAINCGVIDQWLLARARGFPPKEVMEISSASEFSALRSITEREYRTVEHDDEQSVEELVA